MEIQIFYNMRIITGIKETLHFNLSYIPVLFVFGLGVLAGIAAIIKLVKKALEKYRSQSIYLILGLMIGSIYAIIMGATTLKEPLAPLSFGTFNILWYSFPSGHSMVSMAFYGYLVYLIYKYVKNKYIKWTSITLLSILIFLIGISRIYLGVHYTSDVVGGFLISIAYLIIYINIMDKHVLEEK